MSGCEFAPKTVEHFYKLALLESVFFTKREKIVNRAIIIARSTQFFFRVVT